jgi:hypothetical protein
MIFEDLKEGEIYKDLPTGGGVINIFRMTKDGRNCNLLWVGVDYYKNGGDVTRSDIFYEASDKEKEWLITCEYANIYIPEDSISYTIQDILIKLNL